MKSESVAMKEIHDIRLNIYEEIKNMTLEERTAYFADSAKETIEKYDIKVAVPVIIHK